MINKKNMKFKITHKNEIVTFCEFSNFIDETTPKYRKALLTKVEKWGKEEIIKIDESNR